MKSTTRFFRPLPALLAAAVTLAWQLPATAVTIDSFTTNQAAVTDPPGGSTVVTGGADIIGTRRNLTSDLLPLPVGPSGAGPVSSSVAGGAWSTTVTATSPDSRGEAYATWDGDAVAGNLNVTGLGGQNLTASSHNALRIRVNSASAGTDIVVDVYSSATASSRGFLRIPLAIAAPTDLFLTYQYDFVATAASPADFANVGAIEMRVRGTEISAAIDIVDTVGPSLTASKRDLDLANSPIVAPVLEGSTFKYRVTVGSQNGLAKDVDLNDTVDPNTALDAASVRATPVAIDDSYVTLGHVGRTVAAPGLLANDFDPDANGAPPELVVAAAGVGTFATTLGGSITVAADGGFSYEPPASLNRVVDTYTYTVQDNDGQTSTGLVKIAIGKRVWFVDDAHPGTNAGTLNNPFVGFTAGNVNGAGGAGDLDAEGDIIFLREGSHTAAVELEPAEWFIGEGEGLTLDGQVVVAAGTDPVLASAGHGIVLSSNNTLRGFTVGNTGATSFDILGSAFGTLNLSNVVLNGTGGALSLTTGVLTVSLDSVVSTSGTHGINLDSVSGSLNVAGATTVSDSSFGMRIVASSTLSTTFGSTASFTATAGAGLFANSGTLNFTGTGNSASATNGPAVNLSNVTVTGATFATVSATSNATGGLLLDNVNGAFTGTGGVINVTAGGGNAFDVNAGSSNVSYGGTISGAGSGRLVDITSRTGGTIALSGNLTATGAGTGINVSSNTSGTFNFSAGTKSITTTTSAAVTLATNGTSNINFTGGGLAINSTSGAGFTATGGATGITVQGSNNTVTSTTGTALNVVSTTIGALGLNFRSIAATGATNGINLDTTGALGGLTVSGSGSTTQGGDNSGGTVQTTGDAIRLVNTRNVSLTNMRIQNVGTGIADAAGAIDATNIQGSNLFRAGTITGMGQAGGGGGTNRNGFNIINTDTDLTMFAVENSVFSNSDGTSSFFFSSARGTSDMGISVTTSDFSDLIALAVQVNAGDTEVGVHTVTSTISNNVFRNASPTDGQGGVAVLSSDQDATHNFTVSNNQFYDLIKGIAGGNSEIVLAQTVGGALNGTFLGNTIGTAAFGNGDRRGIGVIAEPDVSINGELGSVDIIIDGNIINRLTDREAIFVDLREDTTNSELIIRNNVIGQLAGFEGQVGGIREAIDVQNRGEVTRTLNMALSNNNVRTTSSASAINLEVNIDNATPGNLTTHVTVTGNTIRNTGTGDEMIARPRDAGAVTTLCLDMTGNTIDGGGGSITLDETGVLNVEQASAAALAAANGIPAGNVVVSGSPQYGIACSAPPV